MCTRRAEWPNHWTMNLVSVAFAGPFITLNAVILETPERLGYKRQTYRSSSPCIYGEQKPDSPTCKVSICSPCTAQKTQKLHNPTHNQTNLDCNTRWQFVFDTGVSSWCFAAATVVSRINAFSVFPNYIQNVFHIISQLFKLVICSESV